MRFGLRTRLLIAFTLVSVFTGGVVAAGSYLQVRDLVLSSTQDRMVEKFRTDVERSVGIDHSPSSAELVTLANRFKALVMFANSHANGNGITFGYLPRELRSQVRATSGMMETRKLGTLVEELIEISRFDAGVAALRPEPVDLAALVAGSLAARGWTDQVDLVAPVTLVSEVDRRRIDVVVANLVGNALRHGARPVSVELTGTDEEVVLVVTDDGPGLPDDVTPLVFERFYKADSARARSEGSGLGLDRFNDQAGQQMACSATPSPVARDVAVVVRAPDGAERGPFRC